MFGFVLGLLVGALIGIFTTCVCVQTRETDKESEKHGDK